MGSGRENGGRKEGYLRECIEVLEEKVEKLEGRKKEGLGGPNRGEQMGNEKMENRLMELKKKMEMKERE